MAVRIGLLLLFVLGAAWVSAARQMADPSPQLSHRTMPISDILVTQMKNYEQEMENQASNDALGNERLCTMCEEFAAEALDYLALNKTQTEILDALYQACSRIPTFKQQCITLVDYYAPLFFLEVSSVQPEAFCRKVNLCQQIVFISSKFQEDRCGICHRAVSEVLIKLKDPDTQLEIIELFLKGCDSMENYASKCKKMVFKYGPIILIDAEQFLESTDICTMLHACDSAEVGGGELEMAAAE